MGAFDFLFGGQDDSAQDAQIAFNMATAQRLQELGERARQDAFNLFPSAQNAITDSINKALGVVGQGGEAQIDALTQGNVNAQNAVLQGLAGSREALLGLPQNFSPEFLSQAVRSISPNTDFFNVQGNQLPTPEASGLRLDPTLINLPTPPPVPQNTGINQLVNDFLAGNITEGQGVDQLVGLANSQGLDLGQLSSILGMTPDSILGVLGNNNATLNDLGDVSRAAVTTNTPRDFSNVRTTPNQKDGRKLATDRIVSVMNQFQSGNMELGPATREVIGIANRIGLNSNDLGKLIGLPASEVRRIAGQFGLRI